MKDLSGGILMRNKYLAGYFPMLSIMLFSLSLGVYFERKMESLFKRAGIYQGMLEFFSEPGIKLSMLGLLFVFFFMAFAAMKLLSDTITELSLLFFFQEPEEGIKRHSLQSVIFLIGGAASLLSAGSAAGIGLIFAVSVLVSFIGMVYQYSGGLSIFRLAGFIFFHVFTWAGLLLAVFYTAVKVYNSLLASLPL